MTGIPSSGTRATIFSPFGNCELELLTAIAGKTLSKLVCADAGNVSEEDCFDNWESAHITRSDLARGHRSEVG